MPELPEVQTVVTTLRPVAVGATIAAAVWIRADIVTPPDCDLAALLPGHAITAIDRRGKRIIFTLDDGNRFHIHLGMTGRLIVEPRDSPPPKHTHLALNLSAPRDGKMSQLRFVDPRRFGGLWWLGTDRSPDTAIGPEPLTLRPAQLVRRLAATHRPIKNALLDQRLIAGLGNIYVDESLFTAGIHPLRPADELAPAEVARLNRAIKSTLRKALRHRGSTLRDYRDADGNPGDFQNLHRVYARAGQPCKICRAPLHRLVLAGRSTHFCPACQPLRP